MKDITERLRAFKTGCDREECERMVFTPHICEEAAEAIESLRKQVRDLNNEAMELAPIIHADGVYMGASSKRQEIDELKAEIERMREAFKEINRHMRTVDKYGLKESTIELLEAESE